MQLQLWRWGVNDPVFPLHLEESHTALAACRCGFVNKVVDELVVGRDHLCHGTSAVWNPPLREERGEDAAGHYSKCKLVPAESNPVAQQARCQSCGKANLLLVEYIQRAKVCLFNAKKRLPYRNVHNAFCGFVWVEA